MSCNISFAWSWSYLIQLNPRLLNFQDSCSTGFGFQTNYVGNNPSREFRVGRSLCLLFLIQRPAFVLSSASTGLSGSKNIRSSLSPMFGWSENSIPQMPASLHPRVGQHWQWTSLGPGNRSVTLLQKQIFGRRKSFHKATEGPLHE